MFYLLLHPLVYIHKPPRFSSFHADAERKLQSISDIEIDSIVFGCVCSFVVYSIEVGSKSIFPTVEWYEVHPTTTKTTGAPNNDQKIQAHPTTTKATGTPNNDQSYRCTQERPQLQARPTRIKITGTPNNDQTTVTPNNDQNCRYTQQRPKLQLHPTTTKLFAGPTVCRPYRADPQTEPREYQPTRRLGFPCRTSFLRERRRCLRGRRRSRSTPLEGAAAAGRTARRQSAPPKKNRKTKQKGGRRNEI